LLLVDGGGELNRSGYGADITRTWAVDGRFDGRAGAAYDACLRAQEVAIGLCTVGTPYRDVHDAACRVLADFLVQEGLLRGASVDQVLERHAHALFFPHGVGHLLGLDVHDLEAFGDLPAYPRGVGRPEPFGTRYLRLNLPLEAGWVVTVEPGFYVVPAILDDPALRARFGDLLDDARLAPWAGMGGIRIEDDVLITTGSPEVLTADVPKAPVEMAALVGAGAAIEEWFA
jgi:Xaa-Pro aminopeptidase